MLPALTELHERLTVVSLPMATRFRGVEVRECVLFDGPAGWSEWSPFLEYPPAEASAWLACAIADGWHPRPAPLRERVGVNATLPAVAAERVGDVLARYRGIRTVKVKVAERGQHVAHDVARVAAVRDALPDARIRLDANGGWRVDEAESAIRALEHFDLEYVEQPCASVAELAEVRSRVHRLGIPIAADESVRKAADPLMVARAGAADLVVVKAQPLGGLARALRVVAEAGLPAVVSSALESSVGISAGVALAAALPELPFDCGLGTASLFTADVVHEPLVADNDGMIAVGRVTPQADRIAAFTAAPSRQAHWRERLDAAYEALSGYSPE